MVGIARVGRSTHHEIASAVKARVMGAAKPLHQVADIKLRPYQSEAIAAAKRAYEGGLRSALITLPTGAGKTVVFGLLSRAISSPSARSS